MSWSATDPKRFGAISCWQQAFLALLAACVASGISAVLEHPHSVNARQIPQLSWLLASKNVQQWHAGSHATASLSMALALAFIRQVRSRWVAHCHHNDGNAEF